MTTSLSELKVRSKRIADISAALGLLEWDQETCMPPAASAARGDQRGALAEIAHEMLVAPETLRLLEGAERETASLPEDSNDRRLTAVARRDYDHAVKVPAELVAEISRASSITHEVWARAREASDFELFAPHLETMFGLARRMADCLGYSGHVYDALLDLYEPGATHAAIRTLFTELRPRLVELTHAISARPPVDDSPLHGSFPVDAQRALTLSVVAALGFDLARGRQDEAAHPFCAGFSHNDVRITTRFSTAYLGQALWSSMHEAGHGMYDQGWPADWEGTPLGGGASLGIHESQSRLWENVVGRSRPFCRWLLPKLKQAFPDRFNATGAEALYRAANRVVPSFIRVEADEVTYNLHILLRFELESELLAGTLAIKDLPDAWNDRMEQYFGIHPRSAAEGVLQDVHWSEGLIGYFPTYTLGNIVSGQLWDALTRDIPAVDAHIENGNFAPILAWQNSHVHQYGRKYLPGELVQLATGKPLSSEPYVAYLVGKYSELYDLPR
ncbi:MAG: carboxypeptidase M32 [Armatimonadetes bacterium]|nr:carboxypeptidase M32 [Armatimonadota bacterium]MDE2207668.1 carboxypeptidase M32 [Armatimonadota bacterium]